MELNMDCHGFKLLIAKYFEGKMENEQLNSFAKHMIECSHCEEYLLSLSDTMSGDKEGGQNNVL